MTIGRKNIGFASKKEYEEIEKGLKEYNKKLYEKVEKVYEKYKQKKRLYFRLPPELCDGEHHSFATDPEDLAKLVKAWAEDTYEGDCIELEVVAMTDEELESLPEI